MEAEKYSDDAWKRMQAKREAAQRKTKPALARVGMATMTRDGVDGTIAAMTDQFCVIEFIDRDGQTDYDAMRWPLVQLNHVRPDLGKSR